MHTDWLTQTRAAYDTVAATYAEQLRDLLSTTPYERAAFGLFADQVRAAGGGPVADIGCGAGRITAHLHTLGLQTFGLDLSPRMIACARRDHPVLRFEIGSMTSLDLADASLGGLLAWYSLIHVPDPDIAGVLAGFRRVLRPSCPLLVAFHAGEGSQLRTTGYGHPIQLQLHRREPGQVIEWLAAAGFTVEAQLRLTSGESRDGAILFAH